MKRLVLIEYSPNLTDHRKKSMPSMTLFGTLDILYYFMSKDHHKRRCKATLNQTFQ